MKISISVPLRGTENLMEIIRDHGYEDWGECRGRTWCRTCHVELSKNTSEKFSDEISPNESMALDLVDVRNEHSRLICQMAINTTLDGELIHYR